MFLIAPYQLSRIQIPYFTFYPSSVTLLPIASKNVGSSWITYIRVPHHLWNQPAKLNISPAEGWLAYAQPWKSATGHFSGAEKEGAGILYGKAL